MECGDIGNITGPQPPCNALNNQWKCNLCLATVYTQDIHRIKRLVCCIMYDYFIVITVIMIIQKVLLGWISYRK